MGTVRNILFIMCDQLRADYLSCNGHPTLETPNIDALAARGVNFNRAHCQSPVCGPSRMSFYIHARRDVEQRSPVRWRVDHGRLSAPVGTEDRAGGQNAYDSRRRRVGPTPNCPGFQPWGVGEPVRIRAV